MREIKFRAWNGKQYSNFELDDIYREGMMNEAVCIPPGLMLSHEGYGKNPDIIIEQYTGLKDKNGVEWYEGEIIKAEKTSYYEIKWLDEELTWILTKPGLRDYLLLSAINSRLWVSVGNIHENPELLKD